MKPKYRNRKHDLGNITLSIILLTILAAACTPSAPENGAGGGEIIMSEKQRQAPISFETARVPQLVDGNLTFAFNLYRQLYDQAENLVLSPHSLSMGLAMTFAGARGETEAQMADVLRFTLPQTQLHPAFNSLDQSLRGREGVELHLANALWGSERTTYLEPFLDTLAAFYGAGINRVDFRSPSESRQRINQWVSDQTESGIPELLPPGSIHGNTDLILTNAIYFQGAWANPFPTGSTHDGTFTRLDGETVPVMMMNQTAEFRYGQVSGAQTIELPYEGGDFSMLVVLPDAGTFDTFAKNLDAVSLENIIAALQPAMVKLSLPRFEFDFGEQLKDTLISLGMDNAFRDADFSGMDGSHELFIDQVYHQTLVNVDEAGTEAAAASAVVMTRKGIPEIEVTLVIDHPFLFLIQDNRSGAVLFLGHVVDPSGLETGD